MSQHWWIERRGELLLLKETILEVRPWVPPQTSGQVDCDLQEARMTIHHLRPEKTEADHLQPVDELLVQITAPTETLMHWNAPNFWIPEITNQINWGIALQRENLSRRLMWNPISMSTLNIEDNLTLLLPSIQVERLHVFTTSWQMRENKVATSIQITSFPSQAENNLLPVDQQFMDWEENQATNITGPAMFHMNILVWNYRSAGNNNFRRNLLDLVHNHQPDVVILTETQVSGDRANQIAHPLPFDGSVPLLQGDTSARFGSYGAMSVWSWILQAQLNRKYMLPSRCETPPSPIVCHLR
ncbi:hypothetical protein CRG98_014535 [Punica granatum]|uniref:Endonuclease/exonuclease/phosphatase domain-containing protein n=1 Tax=Punica granatum TaxID=22663 RepID=A0A2I0KBB1_PUNGR|nr:hypothetical protein CRG98_014535 [Punica granatum]